MKVAWRTLFALLAFGGCDMFDKGPEIYTTVVEGVAVDADSGQPLARIGVGFRFATGNGAVRPTLEVDSTDSAGQFRLVRTAAHDRELQFFVWDLRALDYGYVGPYYAIVEQDVSFVQSGTRSTARIGLRWTER